MNLIAAGQGGKHMKVGICGTGKMGTAIAMRLMDKGHEIVVWNRTAERAAPLVEKGATEVATPAALACQCDAFIVMVYDDDAVEAVYSGQDGVLSVPLDGKTVILMSTTSPAVAREAAKGAAANGGVHVECPVGGTVPPALNGELLGLAGGEADAFEKARPLLEDMCRKVEHTGPAGTGAAMKLAINLPLIAYWESLAEALSFAQAEGVDREVAGSLMSDSSGAIKVAPPRIPNIVKAIDGDLPETGFFTVAAMAKDLRLMHSVAEKEGFSIPVADAALSVYDAAEKDGWGIKDGTMIAAWKVKQK
jgi:3-hydroxyisobutyrate dehydrogenase